MKIVDPTYLTQLQTLVRTFSSIESEEVRQYVINIISEILKISNNESKTKEYIDDLLNKTNSININKSIF